MLYLACLESFAFCWVYEHTETEEKIGKTSHLVYAGGFWFSVIVFNIVAVFAITDFQSAGIYMTLGGWLISGIAS